MLSLKDSALTLMKDCETKFKDKVDSWNQYLVNKKIKNSYLSKNHILSLPITSF